MTEPTAVDRSDSGLLPAASAVYASLVDDLLADYSALPVGAPVRLAKATSNLFRIRADTSAPGLDVAAFDGVLQVDPVARTADVLGMTTYEHLVEATLAHELMPLVVPQLKTITLGGAVTGLGIESTSFKEGMPHESVVEMDILTGDGRVVTARPDNEHADLFFGFPNSYGTLGYALRLRIELAPVRPFVEVEHLPFTDERACAQAISDIVDSGHHDGRSVDFLDGTVFSPGEVYLTIGRFTDRAPYTSDYTGNWIYYRSIRQRHRDYLTVADYLWRWDTDWFWCSGGLGVQKPWVRPFIPRRYLRSDVYFKAVGFGRRSGLDRRLTALRGEPAREYVIQDIEVPVAALADFLRFFHETVGILPVWLCPLRQRDSTRTWDLYALSPEETYVNVGFWSSVPMKPGAGLSDVNRAIEQEVERLGGRKSLYSSSFYPEDEFWRIYNGSTYEHLKTKYDPGSRFLDLFAKCVGGR